MLRKVLSTLLLIWANLSLAQEKAIIPPAPNAANLVYNTEMSMGLYTGTPQISIPVWTVNAGVLQLPITLSYTSGGVKVGDMASWCGLGWNLNAGGVITRSVLGRPDETPTHGYIDYTIPPVTPDNPDWNFMAEGTIDTQEDLFFLNFPGGSCRFVFDKTGTPQLIPKKNYKITKGNVSNFLIADGNAYCIQDWEIVDDKGVIYRFKDYEKTSSSSRFSETQGAGAVRSINSWYLTEMESPAGEKILFNYTIVDLAYDFPPTKTGDLLISGQCEYSNPITSTQRQYVNTKRLTSIDFPEGKIRFIPASLGRADLVGDNALDRIIVEDKQGQIIRQFKLDYKYLVGNSLVDYTSINPAGDNNFLVSIHTPPASFSRRLMLMKYTEQDANGVALNNGETFEYHTEIGLPHRASPLTDHWGYANKAYSGNPEAPYILIDPDLTGKIYMVGKSSDYLYAKEGSLYKINHSTGGSTEYEFESNEAAPSPMIPPKVFKNQETYSLSISHYKYNVDGWYEQYNYEIRPDGDGHMVRNYYVEFTVTSQSAGAANVLLENVPYYPAGGLNFYIENVSTGYVVWRGHHDGNYPITLPAGVYRLYHCPSYTLLNSPQNPDHQKLYSALISGLHTITVEQGSEDQPPKVAGIRVKKIKQYDPVAQKTLYKEYKYEQDGSSGTLLTTPQYQYEFDIYKADGLPGDVDIVRKCRYLGISYNSVSPLSTTHNSFVGYQFVEERIVSEAGVPLGKTEYSFMGPLQSPDVIYKRNRQDEGFYFYDAPNPPVDRRDWLRGFLTQQVDYKYDNAGQTFYPVHKIVNTYKKTVEPVSEGLQVNITVRDLVHGQHELSLLNYSHYSGTIFIESTEEVIYQGNEEIKTTTTIENSQKSFLPVTKSIAQSDGSLSKEYYTYPKEYAAGDAAIDNLISKNIVSVPIETVKLKEQPAGTFSIIGGSLTNYYPTGSGKVQSIGLLETNGTIPLSTFKFSNAPFGQLPTSLNASQFATDTRYQANVLFNSYDSYGNLTESQKANNVKEVYLWGYNGTYPVAKIVGIDHATVSGSGIIDQSMLDNAIAYTDQQIRDELNKIRTWFSSNNNVIVSTYTYAPLIGMTSQTDANNVTIYYEYDSYGRLTLVRDENNKILKKICYNYAGQTGNCSGDVTPIWQPTGPTRCKPCPSNSNYITNILQQEEKDANPNSLTFNQVRWNDAGASGSCIVVADWQNTSTALRCKTISGSNTSEREQEQKDMNPCSATYNQLRWLVIDVNCSSCPKPENWQATGNYRCAKDVNNYNTGYQEREERNMETCSSTYNQVRWLSNGYNTGACPLPALNVSITANNYTPVTGFSAQYTNKTTFQVYTFSISSNSAGLHTLGTIPSGTYDLVISKPGNNTYLTFGSGCGYQSISDKSATFNNISVSESDCNSIWIDVID